MKSHVKYDYLKVMQAIYTDACVKCAAKVSHRDLKTIRSRVEDQGISFLTIALPAFCSDFERSLDKGLIDSNSFANFRKLRRGPAFLRDLISQIFNYETGSINDEIFNDPLKRYANIIASVRQICLAFKKVKLPCTEKRSKDALEGFIENERNFNLFPLPPEDDAYFKRVSFVLWNRLLRNIRLDELSPRHGPGATAERLSGNRKYAWRYWFSRVEPYFPLLGNGFPISMGDPNTECEELELVSFLSEQDEFPSRVSLVPKTLKSPRVIAIEPCCMQFAQQAISRDLVSRIEGFDLTSGHVNFRDQSVNQKHALTSSATGRLATIDLSDASDRVPLGYALEMFQSNPDLRDAIEACRSRFALLPDGRKVQLRKFASMGSALCFPVEAMYFYTICVGALLRIQNLPVSYANIKYVSRDVYVYGDDILVPSEHAVVVLDDLRKYNCKVNTKKTFYTGRFRESCGVDAYDGVPVKPVYINQPPPENKQQVHQLLSWVAAGNQFFNSGYFRTASLLFTKVEKYLGKLPSVHEDSGVVGRNFFHHPKPRVKWNRRTHQGEILCWVMAPVYRTDKLDGYAALMKSLTRLEDRKDLSAPRDVHHLERSALHGEVALKRRWVQATSCLL